MPPLTGFLLEEAGDDDDDDQTAPSGSLVDEKLVACIVGDPGFLSVFCLAKQININPEDS
jgi:hypothetical protein